MNYQQDMGNMREISNRIKELKQQIDALGSEREKMQKFTYELQEKFDAMAMGKIKSVFVDLGMPENTTSYLSKNFPKKNSFIITSSNEDFEVYGELFTLKFKIKDNKFICSELLSKNPEEHLKIVKKIEEINI